MESPPRRAHPGAPIEGARHRSRAPGVRRRPHERELSLRGEPSQAERCAGSDASVSAAPAPLEIRGLTRRYGEMVAVDHLDLEVRGGEILGFLGPNGAGKTTTLRCTSGLLRSHSGTIRVAGFDLEREALRARAAMGFVPDRPFLYPRLTAREFLDLVGSLYDVPGPRARERGDALLSRLDLGAERDDLIETY